MGSYTELYVDNHPVLSSKSYVYSEVMTIFSESDKVTEKRKVSQRNPLVWGVIDDHSYEVTHEYVTTVGKAIDRLEIMGFNLERSLGEEIELMDEYIAAFKEIRENNVPLTPFFKSEEHNLSEFAISLARNDGWMYNFPANDLRSYLRVLLESADRDQLVTQDLTEVTHAGYYDHETKVRDNEVDSLTADFEVNSKIIILTEGSSDRTIIERSLSVLYPHLSDYYSFMDFGLANASGGASSLVANVKAFVGTGIKNKVVAILDNDTAAFVAVKGVSKISLPDNIKVIHYPYLPFAEKYPTLGPTGNQRANINGLAGSVELYLGEDVLKNKSGFIPIQWKGYEKSLERYQGEIMDKTKIQQEFYKKLEVCEKDRSQIDNYDWSGMHLLLQSIFKAFR
ncbi:hypothetical protein C9I94_04200 [Photobacterium swingsii]|uniref:HEPN/Toprim N-terminal domain-containing protein n=2 Tax=Photobacterium swingsii TaxID=680026 RepID=A0A2T3PD94_9GAMM|nr:HEPN/Toprim-associated domain-containing protein [Photobacterium swingsii]PSW27178.1 hypothetical protein C9I94_04200 [Photobacterium swingsii]